MCFITFFYEISWNSAFDATSVPLLWLQKLYCVLCLHNFNPLCVFSLTKRQSILYFKILQFLFSCYILTLSWKISTSTSKRTRTYSLLRSQKRTIASGMKTGEQFAPLLCHLHNRWHTDGCYGRSAGIPGIYLLRAAHKCVPATRFDKLKEHVASEKAYLVSWTTSKVQGTHTYKILLKE